MKVCAELWGEVGPESYRAIYRFLGDLAEIHQDPENEYQTVSSVSALRHQIRGKLSRIASNVTRGHGAIAYEICQSCVAGDPFDLETLKRFDPDGLVMADFGNLKTWIETTFAEEKLPAEFQGKGLGLTVNTAESVPLVPPFSDPAP